MAQLDIPNNCPTDSFHNKFLAHAWGNQILFDLPHTYISFMASAEALWSEERQQAPPSLPMWHLRDILTHESSRLVFPAALAGRHREGCLRKCLSLARALYCNWPRHLSPQLAFLILWGLRSPSPADNNYTKWGPCQSWLASSANSSDLHEEVNLMAGNGRSMAWGGRCRGDVRPHLQQEEPPPWRLVFNFYCFFQGMFCTQVISRLSCCRGNHQHGGLDGDVRVGITPLWSCVAKPVSVSCAHTSGLALEVTCNLQSAFRWRGYKPSYKRLSLNRRLSCYISLYVRMGRSTCFQFWFNSDTIFNTIQILIQVLVLLQYFNITNDYIIYVYTLYISSIFFKTSKYKWEKKAKILN